MRSKACTGLFTTAPIAPGFYLSLTHRFWELRMKITSVLPWPDGIAIGNKLSCNCLEVHLYLIFHTFSYLRKTFSRVLRHSQPHVIAFLGDLMDEGHIAPAQHFEIYKQRFDNIFKTPDNIMVSLRITTLDLAIISL